MAEAELSFQQCSLLSEFLHLGDGFGFQASFYTQMKVSIMIYLSRFIRFLSKMEYI